MIYTTATAEAWRNQMIVYHYVVVATTEEHVDSFIVRFSSSPDRAESFCVCCLATCFEHDASAAQVEVTKRGNILTIIWNCTVLAMMGEIKVSGGRVRLTSLMLIFLFSRATGQYCRTYFRLLTTDCCDISLPILTAAKIFEGNNIFRISTDLALI